MCLSKEYERIIETRAVAYINADSAVQGTNACIYSYPQSGRNVWKTCRKNLLSANKWEKEKQQQLRSEIRYDRSLCTMGNARILKYACNLGHISLRFRNSFIFVQLSDVHLLLSKRSSMSEFLKKNNALNSKISEIFHKQYNVSLNRTFCRDV